MPGWMVRVNDILKQLGSHNLLATPSEADLADPNLAPLLDHYFKGADDVAARERTRLFRTAWDFAGSALGARVGLYERFYFASAPRWYALAHMLAQMNGEWNAVPDFWKATDEMAARNLGGLEEAR